MMYGIRYALSRNATAITRQLRLCVLLLWTLRLYTISYMFAVPDMTPPSEEEAAFMGDSAAAEFPPDVLGDILIQAGAWPHSEEVGAMQLLSRADKPRRIIALGGISAAAEARAAVAAAAIPRICGWSICRAWRDCLRRGPPPDHLARLLLEVHGPDQALIHAVRSTSLAVDRCDLVRAVLGLPGVRADCMEGEALISAAGHGHTDAVRLLLEREEHVPRADCQEGEALVAAASEGHVAVVRLLLDWSMRPRQIARRVKHWSQLQARVTRQSCGCFSDGGSMRPGPTAEREPRW